MIQQTPQVDLFKQQLRESLQREMQNVHAVKIARHANVYTCGDQDEVVYFIESGQIKLLMASSEGKECLLAIHTDGDIFGELCLSGLGARLETATAMKQTMIKQIPCNQFLGRLSRDSLFEGFVRYLAVRIADQQQVIANLVTVDSEQRLGQTLLQLARTMGKKDPRFRHRFKFIDFSYALASSLERLRIGAAGREFFSGSSNIRQQFIPLQHALKSKTEGTEETSLREVVSLARKEEGNTMEIPRDISRTATALILISLVLVLFFGYRAHVNSRNALQILEIQVPNITRVAFDTQVFALTPANLEPVLTSVAPQFGGPDGNAEVEKLSSLVHKFGNVFI
jgi:CRP/FNR family transcriptional regulator, cyclic AMP receptor protein